MVNGNFSAESIKHLCFQWKNSETQQLRLDLEF